MTDESAEDQLPDAIKRLADVPVTFKTLWCTTIEPALQRIVSVERRLAEIERKTGKKERA